MQMSDVVEAEAEVAAIERNITTISNARTQLSARLPALRGERTDAARATLLAGAARRTWQAAVQAEQEASALLADMDAVVALLTRELVQARYSVENVHREAHRVALAQRLRRVATENNYSDQEASSFLGDVARAYQWLRSVPRTDSVDHKHSHTWWIDQVGSNMPTRAFVLAVMCHGDVGIEFDGTVISFGLNKYIGKPAASLPLTGDPTPAPNRSLITTVTNAHRRVS
jgi:hypothetical protein